MGRVKKHIAQKRKQALKAGRVRWCGTQLPGPPPPQPPVPPTTTSAQKRKSLVTQDSSEKKGVSKEHIIVVKDDIEFLVKNMACGECLSDELEITFTQHQIDTYYKVNCENGHVIIDTNMTRKPKLAVKEKYYPLTTMLVFCMMVLGVGYDGVSKVLAYLSLRHFTEQTYIRTAKYLTKKATIHTDNILEKSRSVVNEHYSNKEGGLDNGMANVDVTFDGSWHKRGHKSNFGVAATVDVDLGLVLDYSVCSKLCTMCTRKKMDLKNEKITEQEYNTWYENHRKQVALKERNKLKRESAANFDTVGDADRLLQQKDEEIRRMQEMLSQMQEKLKESGKEPAVTLALDPGKRDSVVNV